LFFYFKKFWGIFFFWEVEGEGFGGRVGAVGGRSGRAQRRMQWADERMGAQRPLKAA